MEFTLTTPFKKWGLFGISRDQNSFIPGVLSYNPDDVIKLEMPKGFDEAYLTFFKPIPYNQVYGIIEPNTKVTLVDCLVHHADAGLPTVIVYGANFLLCNEWIDDFTSLEIKQISCRVPHLLEWTGEKAIDLDKNKKGLINAIKLNPLKKIKVDLSDDGFLLTLEGSRNTKINEPFTINHYGEIIIKPVVHMTFENVTDIQRRFLGFMTLLMGVPMQPDVERITFKGYSRKVYFLYRPVKIIAPERPVHAGVMPLPFFSVEAKFESMCKKWYAMNEQQREATRLFTSSQFEEGMPLEIVYLTTIQILEAYHRGSGKNHYMKQEAYKDIANIITNAIPDTLESDHRTSLKNRIKYGNEYSLRKRLALMIENIPQEYSSIFNKDYVHRAVETRNFLTHYDINSKDAAYFGMDLYQASKKMMFLVYLNFLRDIGLTELEINGAVRCNRKFMEIII